MSTDQKSSTATEGERIIRCAVPVYDLNGEPDFYYVSIAVPLDYVNMDEDDANTDSHHHSAARKAAMAAHYSEVTSAVPVYDSEGNRWEPLLGLFDWDSSSIYDLAGKAVRP